MPDNPKHQDKELPKEEIEKRRDAIARRMLATPPKPRTGMDKKRKRDSTSTAKGGGRRHTK